MTGSKRTLWAFQFQAWYSNLHLFTCIFQELYDSEQERHVAQSTASECLRPWQNLRKKWDLQWVWFLTLWQNSSSIPKKASEWSKNYVCLRRPSNFGDSSKNSWLFTWSFVVECIKCHLLEVRKKQDIKLLFFCRLVPYCQNRVKRRKWRFLITLRLQRITEEGLS